MIEFVEPDPAQLKFANDITTMLRTDSHSTTHQNITINPDELKVFLRHLWDYFKEAKPVDQLKLTHALIQTKGYVSCQQQATRIIDLL
jgi:hypothetical protein